VYQALTAIAVSPAVALFCLGYLGFYALLSPERRAAEFSAAVDNPVTGSGRRARIPG
jgi:hypothetical protein